MGTSTHILMALNIFISYFSILISYYKFYVKTNNLYGFINQDFGFQWASALLTVNFYFGDFQIMYLWDFK